MKKLFILLVLALAVMSSLRGRGGSGGCTGLCSLMIAQLEASSAAAEKPRLALDHPGETPATGIAAPSDSSPSVCDESAVTPGEAPEGRAGED